MVQRPQQVGCCSTGGPGSAQGLAVQGDDSPAMADLDPGQHPGGDQPVQRIGIHQRQSAPDRRFGQQHQITPDSVATQRIPVRISDPFADRQQRSGPGQDRAHCDRQDHRQPVPAAPQPARVRYLGEDLDQRPTHWPSSGPDKRRWHSGVGFLTLDWPEEPPSSRPAPRRPATTRHPSNPRFSRPDPKPPTLPSPCVTNTLYAQFATSKQNLVLVASN